MANQIACFTARNVQVYSNGKITYKQVIDGGFQIEGDITGLDQASSSLVAQGTITTGTNGGTTVIGTFQAN